MTRDKAVDVALALERAKNALREVRDLAGDDDPALARCLSDVLDHVMRYRAVIMTDDEEDYADPRSFR